MFVDFVVAVSGRKGYMKQITDLASQLIKEESSAINPILPQDNIFVNKGWQCPICGRVYSPTTPMCFYCGKEINATATQTRSYSE